MFSGHPVYTIGYEGITADELVEKLKSEEIDLLLDVRIRAGSRKKGLSKTPLSASLQQVGIEYMHDRDLGTPREIMTKFKETGVYDWDAYVDFLNTKISHVEYAAQLTATKKVCLLCFEANAEECHRRFVAAAISKISGHATIHLRVTSD